MQGRQHTAFNAHRARSAGFGDTGASMTDTADTARPSAHPHYLASLRDSFSRILPMAWPVLIGQLAVLGFSTVDTILVARFAANDQRHPCI